MKTEYDFSKGKRGPVLSPDPEPDSNTRITTRLDEDIIDYFLEKATDTGGALGYQTLINRALREFVDGNAPKSRTRCGASFEKNSKKRPLLRGCRDL